MRDFCGCPAIEPFATLTDRHVTLVVLAAVLAEGGGPADLEALRVSWDDRRAQEAALGSLAAQGFEAFPQLVLAADPDDLAGAALGGSP